MRYFLPPPDEAPRREIPAIRGIDATEGFTGEREAPSRAPDDGRLIRTVTMTGAQARAHLADWQSESVTHEVPAPPGIIARERSRADRVLAGALRRQRLAVAITADAATAVHWSVPEPPTPADERAWRRVIARLTAPAGGNGWSA